ncbi:MAG TPA: GAF domain-containing protein [Gaiellaceae bacterium]|nr:GAF domain-containing protein [Gaiellaceae bacterium]
MTDQAYPAALLAPARGGLAGERRPVSAWIALLLAALAVAATAGAVYLSAASNHAPDPLGHAVLSVVVCLSFVGAGLVALRRPPFVRFGFLLVAVGFSSLLGSLHDANLASVYTIGVLTANLVFAVLVHALLAFPHGRLRTRSNRILAAVAYANVLALQAVSVLFDPLTRWASDHPRNVALIDSHPSLATALAEVEAAVALVLAVAVAWMLYRRTRMKSSLARRQLAPVVLGGTIALLAFAAGLVVAPISSRAAVIGIGLGLLASLALPAAFLVVLLQSRLSRAAVGELLVELREEGTAAELERALRRALGDPSLELARRGIDGAYHDARGDPLALPEAGDQRVATPVRHQGEPIGMLVHDGSLRLRPELLDGVAAAAGLALANERALETVQTVEERNTALLDAIPDLMIRVSRDGTYLDVRANDAPSLVRPVEELLGANVRDFLPADVADHVLACVARALDTGAMSSVEYELTIDGVARCLESRMVPSGDGEVVTIVRDFTVQRRAEVEERRLAEEQAALRRVATLVAGNAAPEEIFQTVTEEACTLLGIRSALLVRYGESETGMIVGKFGDPTTDFLLGSPLELDEGAALTVLRTGAPVRVAYDEVDSEIGRRMLSLGYRWSVGVPITVAGSTWGALIAALRADEALPPETKRRLQAFAELVGLALASAQARDELAASRLRIVEASDAERRRLERNLHDGAQQRLVALSLALRLAQAKVRQAPVEAEELLNGAAEELGEALTELRELARGIHPAVLTDRGLGPALEALAARAPLPVALEVRVEERLPEQVEAAAYYVASEALANIVKHANAGSAVVRAERVDGRAVIEVEDDGVGGADTGRGSGLGGLRDRVETLNGTLDVASPLGRGTLVRAALPVRAPAGDAAARERSRVVDS